MGRQSLRVGHDGYGRGIRLDRLPGIPEPHKRGGAVVVSRDEAGVGCQRLLEIADGGLMAALMMSLLLLPTLYVWIARTGDALPEADYTLVEEE